MSHGNGEDLFQNSEVLHNLSNQLEVNVFMYEFCGYSLAEGEASEDALYESIDAAYAHLTQECHVDNSRLILHGRSLGSAPTVDLASRLPPLQPVAGMILVSPIASGARIILGRAALLGYPLDMFRNDAKIGMVTCPTILIHGTEDQVVPHEHGKILQSLLQDPYPPLWLEGAGHNDLEFHYGRQLISTLREFIAHIKLQSHLSPGPGATKRSANSLTN